MSESVSDPNTNLANAPLAYYVHRKHDTPKHIEDSLEPLKGVFLKLDQIARTVEPSDPNLAEVVNASADILRGIFDKVGGVDVQPRSELGPHDDVDVKHSMMVLSRVVEQVLSHSHDAAEAQGDVTPVSQVDSGDSQAVLGAKLLNGIRQDVADLRFRVL